MLLLALILRRSPSDNFTKAIRSDDPCNSDFWDDTISDLECKGKLGGSRYECPYNMGRCTATTTATNLNWSIECEWIFQRCRLEVSHSWIVNGPSDASAVCEGECSAELDWTKTNALIVFGVLCLVVLVAFFISLARCCKEKMEERRRRNAPTVANRQPTVGVESDVAPAQNQSANVAEPLLKSGTDFDNSGEGRIVQL